MLLSDLLLDKIRDELSGDFASLLRCKEILERHSTKHVLDLHVAPY